MRIGEFSDSFIPVFDGVGRVVKAYCETLCQMDNEVYAIVPVDDTGYRGELGYEIVDYLSTSFSRKIPYKIGISALDRHFTERLSRTHLDICHVHCPAFSGFAGVHYAKKHNIPLVGTFHSKYYDDIFIATKSRAIASIGAKGVANFYSNCDEVWAVSDLTGETLKSYGYKGKLRVMPNGTERRILDVSAVGEVVKAYGLNTSIPIILFVGQINWKKNLKRIIEACGLLKKHGYAFQLVFAGRGPDEDAVKKLAIDQGLEDRFVMTGHIQDTRSLDALYSVAELFLFPSIYDNAPLVVREAANMHTPSLVSAGSCAAEVVKNRINGIVADNDDESVYQAVKSFLDMSQSQRDEIAEKAYETIPVPWKGPLMEAVLDRYAYLIKNHKG